jgi:NitT/TauT family transport system substrate-binding protein
MTGRKIKIISIAVLVCALLAVFNGCTKTKIGAVKNPKKLTNFRLGHLNTTSHLLGFVAAEEDFFQEEGLNVTLTQLGSTREIIAGLESDKLDAAFTGSVGIITQQAAGHDVTIFGGAMSNGHGFVLKTKFIPADFKRGDISVLKGRNLATAKNSVHEYELLFLLNKEGIEIGEGADKVNIVYFASLTEAFSAFASDQIDGVNVGPPYTSIAKNAGHTVVYYCNEISSFQNEPCCRQFALTSAIAARPELYIAFERPLSMAYKFSQENHAKTVEDVSKYIPVDKKDIEYEIYSGYAFSHPDPDKKATLALKRGLVDFGYTDGVDYDIEKYYNTDVYKKDLAQVLAENPNDFIYKSLEEHFNSAN